MCKTVTISITTVALACLLTSTGCSDRGVELNNTATGAALGTAMGAGLGAIVGNQTGNAGAGVAIGAGAGALTGAMIGAQGDRASERSEDQEERLRRQERELQRQRREIDELRGQRQYDDSGYRKSNGSAPDSRYKSSSSSTSRTIDDTGSNSYDGDDRYYEDPNQGARYDRLRDDAGDDFNQDY